MRNPFRLRRLTTSLLLAASALAASPLTVAAEHFGFRNDRSAGVGASASALAAGRFDALPGPAERSGLPGLLVGEQPPARLARGGAAARPTGIISALVLLEGEPALRAAPGSALRGPALSTVGAAAQALTATQTAVASALEALGTLQVTNALRFTENALVVTMDAALIDRVEAQPNVRAVVPDQLGELHNAYSVPFIEAVQAWQSSQGLTGQNIRIGIIDSGIDYTHATFGGSGDVNRSNTQDTADISDILFDGSKVVSGYDFIGDGWVGGAPIGAGGSPHGSSWIFGSGDNDPADCNGHGTHVAGTAAGFGVTAGGATYTGPWDATVPFAAMGVGPGVAPEAELYALKIGDCSSRTSFVAAAQAIEYALDPDGDGDPQDHLHVLNNSYGGIFGRPQEVLVQQFELAAQAGIIMVASAGNSGDTYFITGHPGVAEHAISVASSTNDPAFGGLRVESGPAGAFAGYPTVIAAYPSTSGANGAFGPFGLKRVGGSGNSQGCSLADYDGFAGEAGARADSRPAATLRWTSGRRSRRCNSSR